MNDYNNFVNEIYGNVYDDKYQIYLTFEKKKFIN